MRISLPCFCSVASTSNVALRQPNLIYRKAKVSRRTVEEIENAKVPLPVIKGEVVFGCYPVLEALRAKRRNIDAIYMKPSTRENSSKDARIAEILRLCVESNIPVYRAMQPQLDRLTQFQLHNGICMDASALPFSTVAPNAAISIFLDGVLDPGNVGAIARSSAFFGITQIVVSEHKRMKSITAAMSKASCGALESFPLCIADFDQFREMNRSTHFVAATDPTSADANKIRTIDCDELSRLRRPICLVLGDEGVGIRKNVLTSCDSVVSIAGAASNITSLNVSVTTGILLSRLFKAR